MKPFVYIFSTSLAICALGSLGGCSPKPGEPGDTGFAGESPAASLTADEAAAYASYSPNLADDQGTSASSASVSNEGTQSQ